MSYSKETLTELDMLLHHCKANSISDDITSDINIATLKLRQSMFSTAISTQPHHDKALPEREQSTCCTLRGHRHMHNEKRNILQQNLDQFENVIPKRKNAKDAILKGEERINKTLYDLRTNNNISDSLLKKVKSTGGQPPSYMARQRSIKPQSRFVRFYPCQACHTTTWLPK